MFTDPKLSFWVYIVRINELQTKIYKYNVLAIKKNLKFLSIFLESTVQIKKKNVV
jgi:hypothetical protein